MKYLNKSKKLIVMITSILSLGIYYPIAVFVPKAIWAKSLMSFDDADPDAVDKILSFSANGTSFLIPLIILLFIIITAGFIGMYFVVKGETKFEKTWGWITAIAGGFGIAGIYALIHYFVGKKEEKGDVPIDAKPRNSFTSSKGFKVATLSVVPVIAIAPIFAIGFDSAGPDVATTIDGVQLAPNMIADLDPKTHLPIKNKDGSVKMVPSNKTNIIELFTDGLDPNLAMPSIYLDKNLRDFTVFNHFVAPGGETSYSLPLEIAGMEGYNEFSKRYKRGGGYATMSQKNLSGELSAFHQLFADMQSKYPNQYLINPTSLGGNNYQRAVSGNAKLATESFGKDIMKPGTDPKAKHTFSNIEVPKTDVKVVNWAQTKKDLAGDFGISQFSPDNSFFGWFNQESTAPIDKTPVNTHVYLREGMTHSPRNTALDGTTTYWTGKNSSGDDLTLYNATHAEISSLDITMEHLKKIDAYDNSLIVIYGDHANHKTKLAHPTNDLRDGDKYHSVAMIKYPKASNPNGNGPYRSDIGFYGGDIEQVIKDFTNGVTNLNTEFAKPMFDNSPYHDQKIYATFFHDHIGYFKFDKEAKSGKATQLHLLDKDPQQVLDIKAATQGAHSPNGWLTYKEFDAYIKSSKSISFDTAWRKLTLNGAVN